MREFRYYLIFIFFTLAFGAKAADITDVLDNAWTGITGTSYTAADNLSASSNAVYSINCAGGNRAIQLRSNNNNSGIVTTTSGGVAKTIKVTWNSNTNAARILQVYGSSKAYSSPSDLYSSDTQGTLIGEIDVNTSTLTLNDPDDYEYIGIRSLQGAMYLDEIDITWSTDDIAKPTLTQNQAFNEQLTVEITSDYDLIYYTTDGTNPTTSSSLYSAPFIITETTMVKAIAVDGEGNASGVASATYTKVEKPTLTISQSFEEQMTVEITSEYDDVYYTIDGTDPTAYSTLYSGPFVITETTTVKAIAVYNWVKSLIATATYTKTPVLVNKPTLTQSQSFVGQMSIEITSDYDEVYYTTDGSTPSMNSTLYTSPFVINETTTVKAIAFNNGLNSKVVAATYPKLAFLSRPKIIPQFSDWAMEEYCYLWNVGAQGFFTNHQGERVAPYWATRAVVMDELGQQVKFSRENPGGEYEYWDREGVLDNTCLLTSYVTFYDQEMCTFAERWNEIWTDNNVNQYRYFNVKVKDNGYINIERNMLFDNDGVGEEGKYLGILPTDADKTVLLHDTEEYINEETEEPYYNIDPLAEFWEDWAIVSPEAYQTWVDNGGPEAGRTYIAGESLKMTLEQAYLENPGINLDEPLAVYNKILATAEELKAAENRIKGIVNGFQLNNYLTSENVEIHTEAQSSLSFLLENEDDIIMVEFYLQLPEGIDIKTDTDGQYMVYLTEARNNQHTLVVSKNENGLYHFLCYSMSNNTFINHSGTLVEAIFTCSDGMTEGTYKATIKNIVMSTSDKNPVYPANFNFYIKIINDIIHGDVNMDGFVDVSDITAISYHIFGTTPEIFNYDAADVNEDGYIDVSDITAISYMIFAQNAKSRVNNLDPQ